MNVYQDRPWHTLTSQQALEAQGSSSQGLSTQETENRLGTYGSNELIKGKKRGIFKTFFAQFADVMIWVLLAAAVISILLKEVADSVIILIVVLLNAVLGTVQEMRAEQALAALSAMAAPDAKVRRDDYVQKIPAKQLVPGDIVLLEAGDKVPADLRLLECASLQVEEAALTGESLSIDKHIDALPQEDLPLGDRICMAYLGSSVTYGRGVGLVMGTGMKTEMGNIARQLSEAKEEKTPLQKKLAHLGEVLSFIVLGIAAVIFIAGILRGFEVGEMLLTAVSLAVAAIPEGMVAVVTIVLALGMQRMAKQNAIIRRLPAVETLGATQVICSDKTGTLTQNRMTVVELYHDGQLVEASQIDKGTPGYPMLLECMARCNDASPSPDGTLVGDPTETALIAYAMTHGGWTGEMLSSRSRMGEIPFDSVRKRMSVAVKTKDGLRVYVKGAVDSLLPRCTHVFLDGKATPLTDAVRMQMEAANEEMASKALRVLALAEKDATAFDDSKVDDMESGLILTGLVGMIDPPREEVKAAVQICRKAGIRPVMITGDHRATAQAIATQIGILRQGDEVLTGQQLSSMSQQELDNHVEHCSVYARVSPEHKVAIVEAWRRKGHVVAMTGDGVNDAPALKTADIGVGMGITGTEVSKGASDMVLTDDNFATIVRAVEEGRKIFDNIRKTIRFLLSSNAGEVLTLFVATMFGFEILKPVHILWINLVTDSLPALAMSSEKAEGDVMHRLPRSANEPVITGGIWARIFGHGAFECILALAAYAIGSTKDAITGTTMAFMVLSLSQLFLVMGCRSTKRSLFAIGLFSNRPMVVAVLISAALQLCVMLPFLRGIFHLSVLSTAQWGIVVALSAGMLILTEIEKGIMHLLHRHKLRKMTTTHQ